MDAADHIKGGTQVEPLQSLLVCSSHKTSGSKRNILKKKKPATPKSEKSNKTFHVTSVSSSSSFVPKVEVTRVKLEARRKLGDRKCLDSKRLHEVSTSSKTFSMKTFNEVVQKTKAQPLKSSEHGLILEGKLRSKHSDSDSSGNLRGNKANKAKGTTFTHNNESLIDQFEFNSLQNAQLEENKQIRSVSPTLLNSTDKPHSLTTSNVTVVSSESDCSTLVNPPAGPSQSDLDHWDMVAEACAGVLQKLDLKGKDEDKDSLNKEDMLDLSPDFEFEDWALSYSASQQDEWDDGDDDSSTDDWMYVTDVGIQCSFSDVDDDDN